ncbi:MAG: hypothetical protein JW816_00035 [Candidatus Buchananbacteria bacterium]|nr:hypothetical protein [Candidatus Buchananbacteria bacterium]
MPEKNDGGSLFNQYLRSSEEQQESENSADYDTNNFYRYLPGGEYRNKSDERSLEIIAAIDKLSADLEIDLEQAGKEIDDGFNLLDQALSNKNRLAESQFKSITADGNRKRLEGMKKIYPLFQKMLAEGFTAEELTN